MAEAGAREAAAGAQHTAEVAKWKQMMESTVADVQETMQAVMKGSVNRTRQPPMVPAFAWSARSIHPSS